MQWLPILKSGMKPLTHSREAENNNIKTLQNRFRDLSTVKVAHGAYAPCSPST